MIWITQPYSYPIVGNSPRPVVPPIQRGWLCPACGCGNAPWTAYCHFCKPTTGKTAPVSGGGGES